MDGYLEEFLKIDWNKPISEERRRNFCRNYEEAEEMSYTFQVLNDQFLNYNLYIEEDEQKALQNQESKGPKYIPGYDSNLRQPNSLFSEKEMKKIFKYFSDLKKGKIVSSQLTDKQTQQYRSYHEAVNEEQRKYLAFARDWWVQSNFNRLFCIHNSVEVYMQELWRKKVEAIEKFYPKTYRKCGSLNFVHGSADDDSPVSFRPIIQLKKATNSARIFVPAYYTYTSLPISHEELVSKKNPEWCLAKKPISADKTALALAKAHTPQVVLTASALKVLANNHPPHYMTEWNLIVTVREIEAMEEDKCVMKKVVFIDKPLPPCSLSTTLLTQWHAKMACKRLFVDLKKGESNELEETPESKRNLTVYTDKDDDWLTCADSLNCEDDDNIESFGRLPKDTLGPSTSQPKGDENKAEGNSISPDRDSHWIDQDCENFEAYSLEENNIKEIQNSAYSYRLWFLSNVSTIGDKLLENQKILRKGDGLNFRPLSLLIRNKKHGVKHEGHIQKEAVVSTKVEYQEDLGAEEMSVTEITNEWMDLLIRPASYLIRGRVSYKGEYIMTEKKQINEVETEALRLHHLNMKSVLKTLQVLLCQLCNLNTGQYYVTHSSSYGAFAHIYTSVPSLTQQAFNLHEFYEKIWSKGSTKEQHAPWKKLDLSIYTPQNYYFKRIPGTFKPSSNAMFSGLQQHMKVVEMKKAKLETKLKKDKQRKKLKNKRYKWRKKMKIGVEDHMDCE